MKRRTINRLLVVMLACIVSLLGIGGWLVWYLNSFPNAVEKAGLACKGTATPLSTGQQFRLVSWNIQYAASRKYHFFYDGGPDVRVKRSDVLATSDHIAQTLVRLHPDIAQIQEVDRGSDRTHRIDEMKRILSRSGPWSCWAWAWYHRSRFVPSPLFHPLGKVDFCLVTTTRYRIDAALRRSLPQLKENWIRRAFNLKRAILETSIPVQGSKRPLVLLNTHLSAFSRGDGTLEKQLTILRRRLETLEAEQTPWVLTGDFNMLPPTDRPARLGKEASYYADRLNPIETLFKHFRSAVSLEQYRIEPERFYTYLPYGTKRTDRTLDYVFVGRRIDVIDVSVDQQPHPLSDHMPIVVDLRVR